MKRMKQEMELNIKMRSIHQKLFAIFLLLCLLAFLTGCAQHVDNVPGAGSYGFFLIVEKDARELFESGKYFYSPVRTGLDGEKITKYGGRDWLLGCGYFDVLTLDFKFKDGRVYHEEIDLRPLVEEMRQKYKLPPQMLPTWHTAYYYKEIPIMVGWAPFAKVNVKIMNDKLVMDYELTEDIPYPEGVVGFKTQRHYYPLFEKVLD